MVVLISSPLLQTAGLHPTAEQIEMFAYHLPDATLSNLIVSIAAHLLVYLSFVSIRAGKVGQNKCHDKNK